MGQQLASMLLISRIFLQLHHSTIPSFHRSMPVLMLEKPLTVVWVSGFPIGWLPGLPEPLPGLPRRHPATTALGRDLPEGLFYFGRTDESGSFR
jgi:hypothetical protein